MSPKQLTNTSKTISYALRHRPDEFGLTLDPEGWVSLSALIAALADHSHISVTESDINDIISASEKKRLEIKDGRIRATYGHSVVGKIEFTPVPPPDVLYHGTSPQAYGGGIESEGIKPMSRQYVHLSTDFQTAVRVGMRHDRHPVILTIDAKRMSEDGYQFFHSANDGTWMCTAVPVQYIVAVVRLGGTKGQSDDNAHA